MNFLRTIVFTLVVFTIFVYPRTLASFANPSSTSPRNIIGANENFSTFLLLAKKVNLFDGEIPVSDCVFFIPTNKAFESYISRLKIKIKDLIENGNKQKISRLLMNHAVRASDCEVFNSASKRWVSTLSGAEISIKTKDKKFYFGGLEIKDFSCESSRVYAIDTVIVPGPESAVVGEVAPNFVLEDSSGQWHALSDFYGKTVVLEWYSADCPFSGKSSGRSVHANGMVLEMKQSLKKLQNDFVYLTINSTANRPEEDVKKSTKLSMKEWDIKTPMLFDYTGRVGRRYGARTTPHVYVISSEGMLVYQGAIANRNDPSKNYVLQAVGSLIKGKKVAPNKTEPWGCGVKYKKRGR